MKNKCITIAVVGTAFLALQVIGQRLPDELRPPTPMGRTLLSESDDLRENFLKSEEILSHVRNGKVLVLTSTKELRVAQQHSTNEWGTMPFVT